MRGIVTLLVVSALAAAAVVVPIPDGVAPGPVASGDAPPVAVCAVEEGRGRTSMVDLLSTGPDSGVVTGFAAGAESGSAVFSMDQAGAVRVEASELSIVGVAAALIEATQPSTVAATLSTGAESMAAEVCPAHPSPTTVLAGGSTLSGEEFELQLMNPYSGQARVRIAAVSEAGAETNENLAEVVVQPRTSAVIDLADLLPGRERLSMVINVTEGNVISIGRYFNGSDNAIWNAVEPVEDSYVLLSRSRGERDLIVAAGSAVDTAYQIDIYGPDGLVEGYAEGVIQGQGFVTVDLDEYDGEVLAARLLATAPVAGFFRLEREGRVALTSGTPTPATRWLMPGLGSVPDAEALVILFNPGTEVATATIDSHLGLTPTEVELQPATVVTHRLNNVTRSGVTVDSDVPIVAMWSTGRGVGRAISIGAPILDE